MSSANLWIKICGNTSLEDAQLAADSGADAVGFIFAPSPRRVTPALVAAIVPQLPSTLEKIGVFVDATCEQIEAAVQTCGLTGVQLHFEGGEDLPTRLRDRFGPALRILHVLHFAPGMNDKVTALQADKNIDAILVDSRTATAIGGTGIRFDWEKAASLFRTTGKRTVAAGGLNPENVQEAISKLKPWGVDVVSGVEAAPGHKDAKKVRAFVENARNPR